MTAEGHGRALAVGEVVAARYVVDAHLGVGGMGAVVAATDTLLARRVALKTLRAELASDAIARQRLFDEARAVASLDHPGIVRLFDILEDAGAAILVMELVDGRSLRAVLAEGPLDLEAATTIVAGVADALAAAHARGVVHRDVKPENILVREDGRPALLDFGIAKAVAPLDASARPTATLSGAGMIVGTAAYVAPERLEGRPITPAADQFALGVLAHEVVTGRLPWAGSGQALLADILSSPPERASVARPGLPPAVDDVIARALAKDPADRFTGVRAFADALSVAARGTGEVAPTPEARSPARARRRGAIALGAVLGAIVVGAVAMVAVPRTPTRAPAIAPAISASSPTDADASASAPTTYDRQPFTASSNDEATRLFREAVRQAQAADHRGAITDLGHALRLDPDFLSARVQLAMLGQGLNGALDADARQSFAVAREHPERLSPRERALLEAMTPGVLDPPDWAEEARRLEAAAATAPRCDLPMLVLAGIVRIKAADFTGAAAPLGAALACEPGYLLAAGLLGQAHRFRRDLPSARAVLADCLARDPINQPCNRELARILSTTGACAELDVLGRKYSSLKPDRAYPFDVRADAAAGLRERPEVLDELVRARLDRTATEARSAKAAQLRAALAWYRGDLGDVLGQLDELEAQPGATYDREDTVAQKKAQVLIEMGERKRAGEVCLRRVSAAAAQPRPEQIGLDNLPWFWGCARGGGVMTDQEVAAQRDAWIAGWRSRMSPTAWATHGRIGAWVIAYAWTAETAADARTALDHAADFGAPPAPESYWGQWPETGEVLRLAGKAEEALPYLERAAHECSFEDFDPRWDVRLAEAHESLGHKPEACGAYRRILDRWGAARSRSLAVLAARAATKRLGCKP